MAAGVAQEWQVWPTEELERLLADLWVILGRRET
jgi:hypothetical protein